MSDSLRSSSRETRTRFEQISLKMEREAGAASAGEEPAVSLKFESGQWKIKRAGVDTKYEVFSIKVPGGDGEVNYLETLAESFDDNDDLKAELLRVASKAAQIFESSKKLIKGKANTGVVKVGFEGEIRKPTFKATRIEIDMDSKKTVEASNTQEEAQKIRNFANEIFKGSLEEQDDESEGETDSLDFPQRGVELSIVPLGVRPPSGRSTKGVELTVESLGDPDELARSHPTPVSSGRLSIDTNEAEDDEVLFHASGPRSPQSRLSTEEAPETDAGVVRALDSSNRIFEAVKDDTIKFLQEKIQAGRPVTGRDFIEAVSAIGEIATGDRAFLQTPVSFFEEAGDKEKRILAILFAATTKDEANKILTALKEQDMWYRLQLALLRSAYDIVNEAPGFESDAAKIRPLLISTKNREYPNCFYNGLDNALKAMNLFISTFSLKPLEATLDSGYRDKLVRYLGMSPAEIRLPSGT